MSFFGFDLERLKRWMGLRSWYLKAVLPLTYPLILNIEPTNRCNLACTFCPRAISGRPHADLPWPLFETIAAELGRVGPILRVFLQKDGEPLLHPRIVDMVARLRTVRAARTISIITNGTLLDEALFLRLAEAGLTDVIVSLDAVERSEYRALKGADRFDLVEQNVRTAVALKRQRGLNTPSIKVRMVARQGHEHQVELFRQRWQGQADAVDITPYHTWMGAVRDERCYSGGERYPCALLWYTGVINADGRVSPCCIDYAERGTFARVGPDGFGPIWRGHALERLRRLHVEGRYHDTPVCGPCEYWQIKENLGSWLRRKYRVSAPRA